MKSILIQCQYFSLLIALIGLIGCSEATDPYTYKTVFNQLNSKFPLIELTNNDGHSRLMISPQLQGRVITSSSNGLKGPCIGWFDKRVLNKDEDIIGGIGGEDRIWIGPLGGQFSFYYQQSAPISEDNWLVPKTMDAEPFQLIRQDEKEVHLQKTCV